jgi:2-methylcitrate dehydratase PrpD
MPDPDQPAVAEVLAGHVLARTADTLSDAARAAVQAFTLDTVAVGIAGTTSPYAAGVRATARAWGATGNGVAPVPTWAADAPSLPAPSAAFVNAFQAHALEFDAVHEGAVLHPFTVVVPVLLAQAARSPMDGATYVAACAAGVDVAVGLGVAATSKIRFFRPATCGLFGATAALARAVGCDAGQTASALGYALAFASGTMQAHVEGTPALAASVGAAARSAFAAVDLARAALPGPRASIEGPFGYLNLFEETADVTRLLDGLPRERVTEVAWKPFPTGRAAHGGIDMTRSLMAQGLTADSLDRLEFIAPPLIHHLVGRPIAPPPLEVNYARLCLPWAAARTLQRGGVGLADFARDSLDDPQTHALARRIEVTVSAITDPAAFVPQRAIARLRDGREIAVDIDALPGSPQRPLSRGEALAKARACIDHARPADGGAITDHLARHIDSLLGLDDVAVLGTIAAGHHTASHMSPA